MQRKVEGVNESISLRRITQENIANQTKPFGCSWCKNHDVVNSKIVVEDLSFCYGGLRAREILQRRSRELRRCKVYRIAPRKC